MQISFVAPKQEVIGTDQCLIAWQRGSPRGPSAHGVCSVFQVRLTKELVKSNSWAAQLTEQLQAQNLCFFCQLSQLDIIDRAYARAENISGAERDGYFIHNEVCTARAHNVHSANHMNDKCTASAARMPCLEKCKRSKKLVHLCCANTVLLTCPTLPAKISTLWETLVSPGRY